MTLVASNGVELDVETAGDPAGPTLLLVQGLGTQLIAWHDDLVAAFVEGGFYVVRFDNRDCGLSTHLHDAPSPNVLAAVRGDTSSASYRLEDLADDAAGLLDALGRDAAHVLGVSMGGMVAQCLAVQHPGRVRSLVSVMSTPGPRIGAARKEAMAALLGGPVRTREEAGERTVAAYRVIGSPGYPFDEAWRRDVGERSFDRCEDPKGVGRQLVAIQASGDRTAQLPRITAPTLVVHGDADPLIRLAGGLATAEAVPGAELLVLPGMGHDLPRPLWPVLLDQVERTAGRAGG